MKTATKQTWICKRDSSVYCTEHAVWELKQKLVIRPDATRISTTYGTFILNSNPELPCFECYFHN